jgi:hypothetical protein
MSAWMFIPYANKKVEEGIWTQELAQQFIYEIVKIDLEQDRFDGEMIEHWKKLKESKN